jgi:hypothetical protein
MMRRAKRLTATCLVAMRVLCLQPTAARAEVVVCEDFEAASLTGPSSRGCLGWDGPWRIECGAAELAADAAMLSDVPYSGGHVVLGGNTRIHRVLDVRSGSALDRVGLVEGGLVGHAGRVLYVGFLQRVTQVPAAAPSSPSHLRYYALEFKTAGGDERRVLDIGHDDRSAPSQSGCYGAASVVNNGRKDVEPGQFQSLGVEDTRTNRIVVKFTFGADQRDRVEIFRNPPSETVEPSKPDAVLRGKFRFDRVALARFAGHAPSHVIDELRFGTQYADVFTPVDPERKRLAEARLQERTRAWDELSAKVDRLLFVKRHAFRPSHIYTECSDGPYRPGGGLFVLSPPRPDGKVTRLFDAGGGICRDPEVSFDGRRILFSYRPSQEGFYHIYEMQADGAGLRRLTDGPFHDLDPFYLPDGRIGMTSTRCKSRALCFWVQAATLFVMEADGANPRPLTANNVNEFTPDLLPDGRILYTRWEYLDKSAIFVQSLWSILPDGTAAQQIYGNNSIHPVSMLQARVIPGTRKMACTLAAHNGNSYGPLAVIDPSLGVDNPAGILNLAPEVNYGHGCFAPYPLDDRDCLVSYGPGEPFGLWLFGLDPPAESIRPGRKEHAVRAPQFPTDLGTYWKSATGRRLLIYRDPEYSCVEAMPLVPRKKPPVVAPAVTGPTDAAPPTGTLVLADVYRGLDGAVPRGRVKFLQIVEELAERDAAGRRNYEDGVTEAGFVRRYGSFMNLYAAPWEGGKPAPSLQAKHVYGTAPVEADGSAHFTVPAERPIYFSALDENHNEIQRMRSYIHLQPGERLGCIGCHEPRHTSLPAATAGLAALRREPSSIEPPPWGAGPFSYQRLVQPVFERRCVSCHDGPQTVGKVDLSGRHDGRGVPASFAALVRPRTNPDRPPLVNFFDSWWEQSWTVPVARPLTFGAAASRLIEVIDNGHAAITLSDEDRNRLRLTPTERRVITCWIDLNCPLWENYAPHVTQRSD